MTESNNRLPEGANIVPHVSPRGRGYGVTSSGVGLCPPIRVNGVTRPVVRDSKRGLGRHRDSLARTHVSVLIAKYAPPEGGDVA